MDKKEILNKVTNDPSILWNIEQNFENEFQMEILKENPQTFRFMSKPTYDTCLAAVKTDGLYLKYIQIQSQSFELCYEAVKNNYASIMFINSLSTFCSVELFELICLNKELDTFKRKSLEQHKNNPKIMYEEIRNSIIKLIYSY